MSVRTPSWARAARQLAVLAIAVAAALILTGIIECAWAQNSPFGIPGPDRAPPAPAAGIVGWLFAKQAQFYRQFTGLIRSAKTDGSAVWDLFGVSFLYGVFHAAGPGHGKAVLASYMVANRETWTRGIVLSFASALLQALVAIAVVGVAAALLNVRATTMNGAINVIETAGYALIIVVGLRLLWVKGRSFLSLLRTMRAPASETYHPVSEVGAAVTAKHDGHGHDIHAAPRSDHVHDHSHHGHGHSNGDHNHAHHTHEQAVHSHDDACGCGHSHGPHPGDLGGAGGWSRGLAAIVATGSRPCSGAILVLVFAMAQGLFWVGAGSTLVMGLGTFLTVATIATVAVMARATASRLATTRPRHGILAMRGIEVAAAALITVFGVMLLCGYLANERMIGL
jgi:nickel/cobalt transporter (NicO) family protein